MEILKADLGEINPFAQLDSTIETDDSDLQVAITNLLDLLKDRKQEYLDNIKSNKKRLDQFVEPGKSIKVGSFSFLTVLRRWNSYTPVLPSKHPAKGGGYFLYHNNVGVVIDPGFNFAENFLNEGFKLDDIDAVLITHAHNDHTVELETIFSLLYKRNRPIEKRLTELETTKNVLEKELRNESDLSACEKLAAAIADIIREKESFTIHSIDLYLNLGTFKKYSGYFDLSQKGYPNYIKNIVLMDSCNEYIIPKGSEYLIQQHL